MKLLNLRLGFACNSSSSHSLLLDEKLVTDEWSEFGWQGFQIQSKDIAYYLLAAMQPDYEQPARYSPEAMRIALGLTELPPDHKDGNVDHQSCPIFVLDPKSGLIDPEFVKDLRTWFQTRKAGVHGGNDNNEYESPPAGDFKRPYSTDGNDMQGRKSGDIWAAIDPKDGTRYRFTFEDNPRPATSPELVDLKITGYCTYGCKYCYQGSTKLGQHASMENIRLVLDDLSSQRVLEVAIGGGEPTQHPEFRSIVQYARARGLIPNVTTRNLKFLREFVAGEWPEIGGIAFSIDDNAGAEKVAGAVLLADQAMKQRITAQIVDKTVAYKTYLDRMLDTLNAASVDVTWLGYKSTGFGQKYTDDKWTKQDWSFMADVAIRDEFRSRISVDTAMISEYGSEFQGKYGAYKLTATENEGVTSCYVDAVTLQHGISSYHLESFKSYRSGMKLISQ